MGLGEKMSGFIDQVSAAYGDLTSKNVWQNCVLETADTVLPHALIAGNGDFVSVIHVSGRRTLASTIEQFDHFQKLAGSLSPYLRDGAHALQVTMICDPSGARQAALDAFAPTKQTVARLGLDLAGVFDDWADRVGAHTADESVLVACWTTSEALVPAERKKAFANRVQAIKDTPGGLNAQVIAAGLPGLRDPHSKFVNGVVSGLSRSGVNAEVLDSHEAVRAIRRMVDPRRTSPAWKPLLPGDPLRIRERAPTDGRDDATFWLYPSVKRQIFDRQGFEYSDYVVEMGGNLHHPIMVTSPPSTELKPYFQQLFDTLARRSDMPWRVTFLIEGDGMRGNTLRRAMSSILFWSGKVNKQLTLAIDQAEQRAIIGEVQVRFRVLADTWVDKHAPDALSKLSTQANNLVADIQGWGTSQATDVVGDPTLGVCASLPGVMRSAPNIPACAPLDEAVLMLPLARPGTTWPTGPMLFRTPDGKLIPYMPGSSKQPAWVDIYVAPPRRGKSILMNTHNIAFLSMPGLTEIPYLSGIDVGPTSEGLIRLYQAALPEHLQHLVVYKRLRMSPEYSINVFDTELGCPLPLPAHKTFLINFMLALASERDPDGRPIIYAGVEGIVARCIELAYDEYSPDRYPKPYSHNINQLVAKAVDKLHIEYIEGRTSWWTIVRELIEKGGEEYHFAASVAQRYAVPLLGEVAAHALSQTVTSAYDMKTPGGEMATAYVNRTCGMDAVAAFPILAQNTEFEIGQARIVSLDLDEVMTRGGGSSKQNGVMTMVAMHVTAAKFFLMPEDAKLMPDWIREYHERRIASLRVLPKRMFFDELHRIAGEPGVVRQLESMTREAPKWNVQLAFASQAITDFSPALIEFSTSKWILGWGTRKGVDNLQKALGLDEATVEAILKLPQKPGPAGSALVAVLNTVDGEVCQVLMNTIGSQIAWALSTTAEDAAIRNALYKRVGVALALKVLARHYPGGSAKAHVERQREQATGQDVIGLTVERFAAEASKLEGKAA